jgi:RimJ/RimL family protein N-acetyltransferase
VAHIDLREPADDDAEAIAEVHEGMLPPTGATDVVRRVITEAGGFAGAAVVYSLAGERTLSYAVARNARGRGVGGEALRLLAAAEPDRPLFALVDSDDPPAEDLLARLGFTELDGRLVLPPTLE